MTSVHDLRTVLQDSLKPELRTLSARLDAIEKVMDAKFDALTGEMTARFDAVSSQIQDIKTSLDLERRLTRLESKQPATH